MAPSKIIVALLLAIAVLAGSLPPSYAIRPTATSKPAAATVADHKAPEKAAAVAAASTNAGAAAQPPPTPLLPGFPFPLFPFFPLFPLPGAPPSAGLPFPLFPPLFPLPGAPPAAGPGPGLPFPLFPPLFPLPGAPPATGGQQPGFPFPLFPLPTIPGLPPLFPPIHTPPLPSPSSPGSPTSPTSPASGSSTTASTSSSSPSPPPPAEPTECMTPLMGLTPCMDYLTDANGVSVPPSTCCDGFRAVVDGAPICLCHAINGDINKIMPAGAAAMDFTRMMSLPATCGVALPLQAISRCSTGPVPPLTLATSPAAAPSPDQSA
ncbi:hypothetical protein ACP4OV_014315 [Aristida adscensionis]